MVVCNRFVLADGQYFGVVAGAFLPGR